MIRRFTRPFSVANILLSFFSAAIFFPSTVDAQLTVTPNCGAAALVTNLVGAGMTVSNIVLNCPSNAYGTFANGNTTNLGLTNGILLTTGSAINAIGPNNSTSAGTCNNTSANDAQLTSLDPQATHDPCILEFDVVPQCNTLQIRFVFGSEEYPEFVTSGFNDAFGFWITGPSAACNNVGAYNNTNVATLPNNTTIVSIDNVNANTNSAYYVDNTGGTTIQYDGFTTVLTRNIALCPCQTYHWKLAIADAGDCIYDSGVFIDFLTCSNALSATASVVGSSCSGCTGSASVVATGQGPFTYSWSPSGGTSATTPANLCPGTYTCTVNDAISCSPAYTVAVTVTAASNVITLSGTQTNITCNGNCNGSAHVTIVGGTGPFTYAWTPSGGTAATASGLCAGTYTCTVTGAGGCTATQTFTITSPPALTATTSQGTIACNGGTTTASVVASGGTSPYTYSWSPSGGTGATSTAIGAGSYTCTITDANGCIITKTFTITAPAVLTATQSHVNVLCNGGTGTASVVVSGGTSPYTYAWSPSGGTGATTTAVPAGTYTCTITDSHGCVTTQTITITQPTALTATQSQGTIACSGGTTTASVVASGGTSPYTYSWSPSGGTGATSTAIGAGSYTCTITDANGCVITKTFTITAPTVLTSTQSHVNVLCNGGTGTASVVASGGTSPYTYAWSPSGGTGATTTAVPAGTYTCTITDSHGCTTTQTVTITQPTALTSTQSHVNVLCNGGTGSASVTASGGTSPYTYAWTPSGGTGATTTAVSAGTYTCTITDANGCTTTQTVIITQPTALTSTQSHVNVLCNGGTGTASVVASGGTSPYTYAWSPSGGTGATTTAVPAGTYTCTVTDANGCTTTQTVTITQPTALTATTSQGIIACNGGTTTASVFASGGTSPYTYSWSPSGGTGATSTAIGAGSYTCTITDANGCVITKTFTITAPTVLTSTQSHVNVLCNGGTGTASVVASGGTSPYTYAWSPSGGTGATTTAVSAGTYICTITDSHGCVTTQTVTITQPTALTATSTSTPATCGSNNGTTTATPAGGTGPYTYLWSPSGGTSSSASSLVAGTYTCTVTDSHGCTTTTVVTVNSTGGISASISSSTNVSCNGGSNGSATATPAGGTGPYTYSWSPIGGTGATASGLTIGTYTCTITDANGCIASATVTITQPTALTSTQSHINVLCNGGTGTASVVASGGTSPYTYSWAASGGTGATTTAVPAGTYTCTITDANGCTTTQTVTITQPTVLASSAAFSPVLCNGGNTGSASVTASGGTPTYTYSWSPSGGTGQTATNLTAQTYTCTITDANGCVRTQTVTVTQPTAVTATSSTVAATCGNSNGSASVLPSGGIGPYTYSWSPSGGTGQTANGLITGNYTCTITDANGCVSTASVNVPNAGSPTATITASSNISCFGGNNGSATVSASGGTGPYTYAWTPSGGTAATTTARPAGTYTVTVTDANGCTATATVTLTQPPALTANTTSSPVLCNAGNTGSASVTASGGTSSYTYSWSPSGGTGQTASNLTAQSYTVTVTDANGCVTTQTTTVTQPTALASSATSSPVLCNAGNTGSASVTASGGTSPYTYAWSPSGGTGQTASNLTAQTYTCTITDFNGCVITQTVTVTEPTAVSLTTAFVQSTCGNANGQASVTASGGTPGYTYSWSPSGGTGQTATGLMAQSYTVTVTDANGCVSTATVTVPNAGSPTATITSSTNVSCFGGNNGDATVSASGGTGPYTYSWAPTGGTGITGTGFIAGNYTVTVTDLNNCTASTTVTITEPPALTISGTSINVNCFSNATGTASVNVSGGTPVYGYVWSPTGGNGANATALIAGNYTCTVTDNNGCIITQTFAITEPPALTLAIAGFNVSCFNSCNGQVVVIPSGGVPNYNFSWNTGCNTPSCSNICAGSYTVDVTDANGCLTTASTTVTQPTAIVITTSEIDAHCGQADGSASSNATGGTGNLTYQWINGPANSNYNNISPATYSVIVTDANGCSDTASTTVNNLNGVNANIISVTNLSCFNSNNGSIFISASGGNGPYTYNWIPNVSVNDSAVNLPAGNYQVTVVDINGCSVTLTAVITQPTQVSLTASALPSSVCSGTNVQLSCNGNGGTPGYSYSWNPGNLIGNNQNVIPASTTTYTAYVTDSHGCSDSTTVLVTVNPVPQAVLSSNVTSGCVPLCVDFSDLSTINSPGLITSWNWDFGDGSPQSNSQNPTHCYSTSGNYTVILTVVTVDGCTSTITMNSYINVYANPVAAFGASPQPTTILNPIITFTDSSTNASTWNWSFGDVQNSTSTLQNPTFTYPDPTCYQAVLTVSSINGCVDTATKQICIDPDAVLFVPNAFTPNDDGINDIFIPVGVGIDPNHFEMWIFDRWGNMIFYTDDFARGWDGKVQGQENVCQIDTYVWKIKAIDITGTKHNLIGKVSLIK